MLKVQDIKLEIDNHSIAEKISFELPSGSLSGLSGPSGIGKTTLLRAIAGLHKVRAGTIILNDIYLLKSGKELVPCHLRQVGYAPQEPSLYPHMTVRENLTFFLQKKSSREQNKRAIDILRLLQIGEKANSYPYQLSGGQAQRVAIARTMINEPQVLLFDETLSGIHAELAMEIGKIIAEFIAEKNIPGILISHDIELSKQISARSGCLTEQGINWSEDI